MNGENVELHILNHISQLVHLNLPWEERMHQIVSRLAELTHSDACSIHLQKDQARMQHFVNGLEPQQLETLQYHLRPEYGEESQAPPTENLPWKCTSPMLLRQIGDERDATIFRTVFVTPILNEMHQCIGSIALWHHVCRTYTADERLMLSTLALLLFGMLKYVRLNAKLERKLQEQARIYELGKALSSTVNIDELLEQIAKISVELTSARGCVLWLLNREQTLLEIKASDGDVVTETPLPYLFAGEGIAWKVVETGSPVKIDDLTDELKAHEIVTSIAYSLICVPIIGKEGVVGAIAAFDKHPEGGNHCFLDDDLNLLLSFAGHAAISIEHARFYERMEELALDNLLRLRELSILYHINTAMRSTVRLNRLLRIILTGVTIGGGLGFNRAILLMVNERAQTLKGILGIGPESGNDANKIWQEEATKQRSLVEMITEVPDDELYEENDFEKIAKSIWLPLTPEQGVFAKTALERRPFNITNGCECEEDCTYIKEILDIERFATVPLIVRNQVIGVIYVDNKYNNVPISDDDLNFLQMFANQAALAIDNATLYSNIEKRNQELQEVQDRLVQMEKLTALGKMAADIAHEIRNPIICVGGFARRLLSDESLNEKQRKYVNIISEEAIRLEAILQDVLVFSKETHVRFEQCNVNAIIKGALELLDLEIHDKDIEVNTFFFKDLDTIYADMQQLKQVFINLLTNALQQVAEKQGRINIMTYNTLSLKGGVTIEVSDNGGGIPAEIIDNIFNPFFTTKGTGTGLGLAIIRKIIENHHGNINVRNRPGVGVTFVINLPGDPREANNQEQLGGDNR